jgi:hypothetical protein
MRVVLHGRRTNLRVHDVSGLEVMHLPVVEGGGEYSLPRGIYIVSVDGGGRPCSVAVR